MSIFGRVIGTFSGVQNTIGNQLLFDKVIGFRPVIHGAGATTCVYNVAAALSDKTTYSVCVLDTHMLQPALQTFLVTKDLPAKDWFDYSGNLSEIVCDTKLRGVKYIGFYHRALNDMLSTKDCRQLVDNLMASLKNVFDIILVDLSDEFTNATAYTAIQCNRIYSIVTPDLACQSGFKVSINTAVTQAVPAYKLRSCILNKSVGGAFDGKMLKLLTDNGFKLIAQIPYTPEILRINLLGERVWGAATTNTDVTQANDALQTILRDILEVTDKNAEKVTDKSFVTDAATTPKVMHTATMAVDESMETISKDNRSTNTVTDNVDVVIGDNAVAKELGVTDTTADVVTNTQQRKALVRRPSGQLRKPQ